VYNVSRILLKIQKLLAQIFKRFSPPKSPTFRKLYFVAVFAVVGVGALSLIQAATPYLALEAEQGNCTGNVGTVADTTASGGQAVRFGAAGGACGSELTLTGLDSTIRANWKLPTDTNVKWQASSVWTGDGNTANGSKLVGTKVVPSTAGVVDMNGLRTGDTYTVKLQDLDASGNNLPKIVTATTATVKQNPITNAAYFDNFNDAANGRMNKDYYDVRVWSNYGDTNQIPEAKQAFVSERHFHGNLFESQGQGGVLIRNRVPASLVNSDGSDRTLTMEFEVDMIPVQRQVDHGKWWEVNFSEKMPASHMAFGSKGHNNFPNSILFGAFARGGSTVSSGDPVQRAKSYNVPVIIVNVDGTQHECTGTEGQFTPGNVRVPIVIKMTRTSAEMFMNGKSVAKCTGFTLPFTKGYWNMIDANYRSAFIERDYPMQGPTVTYKLSHWDMIQWDGPAGSVNPVMKTFVQTGCDSFVVTWYQSVEGCEGSAALVEKGSTSGTGRINIPSATDLQNIKSAKLHFTGPHDGATVTLNGQSIGTVPRQISYWGDGASFETILAMSEINLTPAQIAMLKTGDNTVGVTVTIKDADRGWSEISQAELEITYNTERVNANPPQEFMPMLAVTSNNFRYDYTRTSPTTLTGTTYLYSLGSDTPVNYTIEQFNHGVAGDTTRPGADAWFKFTSPTTGTATPLSSGGKLIPINFTIDLTKFVNQTGDPHMGVPAMIKVSGGHMPVYVAVLVTDDRDNNYLYDNGFLPIKYVGPFTYNQTIYNRDSLPQ
jgi:hypothetical protein